MRGESKKQIALKKKRFFGFAGKLLKKHNIETDIIDLESRFDSSLTLSENKDALENYLENKGLVKAESDSFEKIDEEIKEATLEQMNKHNQEIMKQVKPDVEGYYEPLDRAIKKMVEGYSNLMFVKGRGGIGKTFMLKYFLTKHELIEGQDYITVAGDISEAYLYELLYTNNGKIIWFKDVMRLLKNLRSIDNLKTACESEESMRIMTNYTYSHKKRNMPQSFIFTGKIIFDYNEIVNIKFQEDFNALISRGDFIELVFSFEDMTQIMRLIAKNDNETKVTNFLVDNYEFIGHNTFNLRTQSKALRTYLWAEKTKRIWKDEILKELRMNLSPVQSFLYQFVGKKAIKTTELKKLLIRHGLVQTIRTAERRIEEWLLLEEIHKVSYEGRDFHVSLFPIDEKNI